MSDEDDDGESDFDVSSYVKRKLKVPKLSASASVDDALLASVASGAGSPLGGIGASTEDSVSSRALRLSMRDAKRKLNS